MIEFGAHACTDVTGFGLMGHLGAMAAASNVDVEIVWDDLPLLPGVLQCLADGIASGAVERNRESSGSASARGDGVRAGHARPLLRSADVRRTADRRARSRRAAACSRRLHAAGDCRGGDDRHACSARARAA